jgi:hypothetical protein
MSWLPQRGIVGIAGSLEFAFQQINVSRSLRGRAWQRLSRYVVGTSGAGRDSIQRCRNRALRVDLTSEYLDLHTSQAAIARQQPNYIAPVSAVVGRTAACRYMHFFLAARVLVRSPRAENIPANVGIAARGYSP